MEKSKNTKSINLLSEEMIQHIQSFLTEKEAIQTTTISRSWHRAWLTRPYLDFDRTNFDNNGIPFQEFALTDMKKYEDLDVKIHRFTLNTKEDMLFMELVLKAIKLGAINLNLTSPSLLPKEVLESKTLIQLSLQYCTLTSGNVNWCSLRSLRLRKILANYNVINKILSTCCHSLEELSLSSCRRSFDGVYDMLGFHRPEKYSSSNPFEKLKFLSLEGIRIHQTFFNDDFSSRFPCLKDLSLSNCLIKPNPVRISSPSVERIKLSGSTNLAKIELDFPRIKKFEYSVDFRNYRHLEFSEFGLGLGLTRPPSAMCESHIWIRLDKVYNGHRSRMFLRTLKKFLMELQWTKIFLYLNAELISFRLYKVKNVELRSRVNLENLTVNVPSSCRHTLFKGLYRVCTSRHITEPSI